jgi:predicted phage-related endonuclease
MSKLHLGDKPMTTKRRFFIGGSDARVIMGNDEAALLRLWQQKRGEVEPEDPPGPARHRDGALEPALVRKEHASCHYRCPAAGFSLRSPLDGRDT